MVFHHLQASSWFAALPAPPCFTPSPANIGFMEPPKKPDKPTCKSIPHLQEHTNTDIFASKNKHSDTVAPVAVQQTHGIPELHDALAGI